MKPQVYILLFAIAMLVSACNLPGAASAQPLPVLEVTLQATAQPLATLTPPPPEPTETPTITPTPTVSAPVLTTLDKPVNCRFGPAMGYSTVGALVLGESASITGKSASGDWWQIQLPKKPDTNCWVAASVTTASGGVSTVSVVAAPQAYVTGVTLKLDPQKITVMNCIFPSTPVNLTGTITTNGPTVVEWHWETSQGYAPGSHPLKFANFDTATVTNSVQYSAKGTYTVSLVVTSPNSVVAQASYKVICEP